MLPKKLNINRIMTDYWEDRRYDDEADKRSQQFRVLAKQMSDLAGAYEDLYAFCEEQDRRIGKLEEKNKYRNLLVEELNEKNKNHE